MNNFSNLTLEKRDNILDGIVLNEPIDLSILDKLINSTLLKEKIKKFSGFIYQTEKHQLEKYRELIVDGKAIVKYNRVKGMDFGRCNPDLALGLFTISRKTRHTLAKNEFEDIDIDNCHPTILEQILFKNSINCPLLTDYINNREEWFNLVRKAFKIKELTNNDKVLMKDIPKNLFIRILFGGSVKNWMIEYKIDEDLKVPKKIFDFEDEIKKIMQIIKDKNSELVEAIKKRKLEQGKTDYNLNGSVSSYFLQEKECIILEEIFKYCKNKNYIRNNNCVLCADGLMISKKYYNPSILTELKDLIKESFDIELNFSNKPMDQDFLPILDKSLNFNLYKSTFTSGLLANYFRILYSNKFIFLSKKLYIYTGTYWKIDADGNNSSLHNFVDTVFYNHLIDYILKEQTKQSLKISSHPIDDPEGSKKLKDELELQAGFLLKVNLHLRCVKKRSDIVKDIINKITNSYIEFDTDPFLFSFTNKIYDLRLNQFVEPRYDQYISITTGFDYDITYSKKNIVELDAIIDTIFPKENIKNYYLTALSTGLYGQLIEYLFVANGNGGNGKGLINSLMMSSVGNYGYRIPSSVLLKPIAEGGNPAIANMHRKRFCLGQEPDENQRICTSTMKELTGECEINCRPLYVNDCKTILHHTLFLECNELPKMDAVNDAVIRRTQVIPFKSKFVDKSLYSSFTESEIKEKNIFKGDPFYKTEEFKQKYKQALLLILFEKFNTFKNNNFQFSDVPTECKEAVRDYLSVSDDLYSWFIEHFEPSNDTVIYLSEVVDVFKSSTFYTNMNKKDKRDLTDKKLITKMKASPFLERSIRDKDTTFNKVFYRKPYIIGYKMKGTDNDVGMQSALDL